MYMRIKELSDELGITPQAIQKRMNGIKGFRNKYTKKVSNRIEISNKGVEILRGLVKDNKDADESKTKDNHYRDELVNALKDTIETQKGIINEQSKQISKLEDLLYIEKTNNQVKDNRLIELQKDKSGMWSKVKNWFKSDAK